MIEIISHRGNLIGPNPDLENKPTQIELASKFFIVEVDIRKIKNEYFLGHDFPQHCVSLEWLNKHKSRLFLHCKNNEAYSCNKLTEFHRFVHENENTVVCSKGYIIKHPNFKPVENSYNMMPEISEYETIETVLKSKAVCTDFPLYLSNIKKEKFGKYIKNQYRQISK